MNYPSFIPNETIYEQVEKLLFAFNGKPIEEQPLPIRVEEIAEFHLHYELNFDNLEKEHGYRDTLGFIDFDNNQIWIDSTMEPGSKSTNEGRYLFTVSHEIGHHTLHRPFFDNRHIQQNLFVKQENAILCRESEAKKEPLEIQADIFAAALLMPEALIRKNFMEILRAINLPWDHWSVKEMAAMELCNRFQASRRAMDNRLNNLRLWDGIQGNRLALH